MVSAFGGQIADRSRAVDSTCFSRTFLRDVSIQNLGHYRRYPRNIGTTFVSEVTYLCFRTYVIVYISKSKYSGHSGRLPPPRAHFCGKARACVSSQFAFYERAARGLDDKGLSL